jgi:hypothetical protein
LFVGVVQVQRNSTEIIDLTPTLNDLGSQGYALAAVLNSHYSRNRQSQGLPSQLVLYFETTVNKENPKLMFTVVKCQITVTNVSFGVKVRGDYVRIVKDYSNAGWTLAALIGG